MDHRPSSHFQLKSQVCLEMIHKDGHTCRKGCKDWLQIPCAGIQNLFRKNRITFFGDFGLSRLSQVRFGPHGGQRLC